MAPVREVEPQSPPSRRLAVWPLGAPQGSAPDACLRDCLQGQAANLDTRGCPWIKAAVRGNFDARLLREGRCERGWRAEAARDSVQQRGVVVLSVDDGQPAADGATAAGSAVDAHIELKALVAENESLAEEILRSYEQLNFLFEMTTQLVGARHADDIAEFVIKRLAAILGTRVASYDTAAAANDPVLAAALSNGGASVSVKGDSARLMGVLPGGDGRDSLVCAERRHGQVFSAAEVRLTASLLEYAGEIIRNLSLQHHLTTMSREATRALVAAIEKKDRYTSGHSERVGFLTRVMGQKLGVEEMELEELEWAGLLHDVGKIGVPEAILNKPGKLTPEEFDAIKRHPEMGYEILKEARVFHHILDGVLYHHENPDGSGYPRGLRGADIPLSARIIHVADVFDALSSTRSYRDKFNISSALQIIRKEAGTKLDAQIAPILIDYIERQMCHPSAEFQAMFRHLGGGA